jgi:hypothetical protein
VCRWSAVIPSRTLAFGANRTFAASSAAAIRRPACERYLGILSVERKIALVRPVRNRKDVALRLVWTRVLAHPFPLRVRELGDRRVS